MIIDDRKKKILQAIITEYINTAEPIGSRTISKNNELGLSSATIRNEMADLEDLGYLTQPHTSSGRIPSDKGYRIYVDEFMKLIKLKNEEIDMIKNIMHSKISELGQIIKQASRALSYFTKYTSISLTTQRKSSVLKAIQIVPTDKKKALVIIVTKSDKVKKSLIRFNMELKPEYLIKVSNIINEKLIGYSIKDINENNIETMSIHMNITLDVLKPIINGIIEALVQTADSEVNLDGTANIFNYPEFKDIVRAKEFLNMIDRKRMIEEILLEDYERNEKKIRIRIGGENKIEELKECSLITATYSFGDYIFASVGLIGPKRMEYGKVVSSMNFIRKEIANEIKKLVGD